jgi:hypothetical protein
MKFPAYGADVTIKPKQRRNRFEFGKFVFACQLQRVPKPFTRCIRQVVAANGR